MSTLRSTFLVGAFLKNRVNQLEYYWDLLHRSWLCKCMELFFVMGQIFLRKLDFAENGNLGKKGPILCQEVIFLSFGDIFIFPINCAIQTNLGTKHFFEKKLC